MISSDERDAVMWSRLGTIATIFAFERNAAGDILCMPMIVRLKMDRAGLKLSRRQWVMLGPVERQQLIILPCDTIGQIDAYDRSACALVAQLGQSAARLRIDLEPPCEAAYTPLELVEACIDAGLSPPTWRAWQSLNTLQRFALVKLSSHGDRGGALYAAMREFGLMADTVSQHAVHV